MRIKILHSIQKLEKYENSQAYLVIKYLDNLIMTPNLRKILTCTWIFPAEHITNLSLVAWGKIYQALHCTTRLLQKTTAIG